MRTASRPPKKLPFRTPCAATKTMHGPTGEPGRWSRSRHTVYHPRSDRPRRRVWPPRKVVARSRQAAKGHDLRSRPPWAGGGTVRRNGSATRLTRSTGGARGSTSSLPSPFGHDSSVGQVAAMSGANHRLTVRSARYTVGSLRLPSRLIERGKGGVQHAQVESVS